MMRTTTRRLICGGVFAAGLAGVSTAVTGSPITFLKAPLMVERAMAADTRHAMLMRATDARLSEIDQEFANDPLGAVVEKLPVFAARSQARLDKKNAQWDMEQALGGSLLSVFCGMVLLSAAFALTNRRNKEA